MNTAPSRGTTDLILSALDDILRLIRKELELLRTGLVESLSSRAKGAALLALAVIAILPGLLFLVIALALALPFSPQTGFAIVGVFLLLLAGLGIWVGIRKLKRGSPEATVAFDRVKEDARWAREQLKP